MNRYYSELFNMQAQYYIEKQVELIMNKLKIKKKVFLANQSKSNSQT